MKAAAMPPQAPQSSVTFRSACNFVMTTTGLALLVFLSFQALGQISDPAYVKGKPKTVVPSNSPSQFSSIAPASVTTRELAPQLIEKAAPDEKPRTNPEAKHNEDAKLKATEKDTASNQASPGMSDFEHRLAKHHLR